MILKKFRYKLCMFLKVKKPCFTCLCLETVLCIDGKIIIFFVLCFFFPDIFLPCPDNLLVNLSESRGLVEDLLNQLPRLFENNMDTRSALGAALQASFKMMVRKV